jgi:hypothetical protein
MGKDEAAMVKGCADEHDMYVLNIFTDDASATLYCPCMATGHAYHTWLLIVDSSNYCSIIWHC